MKARRKRQVQFRRNIILSSKKPETTEVEAGRLLLVEGRKIKKMKG